MVEIYYFFRGAIHERLTRPSEDKWEYVFEKSTVFFDTDKELLEEKREKELESVEDDEDIEISPIKTHDTKAGVGELPVYPESRGMCNEEDSPRRVWSS